MQHMIEFDHPLECQLLRSNLKLFFILLQGATLQFVTVSDTVSMMQVLFQPNIGTKVNGLFEFLFWMMVKNCLKVRHQ